MYRTLFPVRSLLVGECGSYLCRLNPYVGKSIDDQLVIRHRNVPGRSLTTVTNCASWAPVSKVSSTPPMLKYPAWYRGQPLVDVKSCECWGHSHCPTSWRQNISQSPCTRKQFVKDSILKIGLFYIDSLILLWQFFLKTQSYFILRRKVRFGCRATSASRTTYRI